MPAFLAHSRVPTLPLVHLKIHEEGDDGGF